MPLGSQAGALFRITALSSNTGSVYIDVRPGTLIEQSQDEPPLSANGPVASTGEGVELQPGAQDFWPGPLCRWFIDAAVAGEGISIVRMQQ